MNKIFTIILALVLSLPISVWAIDDAVSPESSSIIETVETEVIDNEKSIIQNVAENKESQFKKPISKRKLAKKFLVGMGAVVASSLILFFGLTIYNRIRESLLNKIKTPEGEVSLQTPDDIKTAIRTFMDKTSWEE